MSEMITVEVAYALPEKQRIERLSVARGTSALQAVEQSNLGRFFDELPDTSSMKLGIFGKAIPATHELQDGERIEFIVTYSLIRKRLGAPELKKRRRNARRPRAQYFR